MIRKVTMWLVGQIYRLVTRVTIIIYFFLCITLVKNESAHQTDLDGHFHFYTALSGSNPSR